MGNQNSKTIILLLLLLGAYLLFVSGYIFFSLLFIVLSFFYFIVRFISVPASKIPSSAFKITPANKTHPSFNEAQEHISRHNKGFGEALSGVAKMFIGVYKFLFGNKNK